MSTDMSSATREVLGRVRQLVPPMLDSFHKGELRSFLAQLSCRHPPKGGCKLKQDTNNWFATQASLDVLQSSVVVRTTLVLPISRPWRVRDWDVTWYALPLLFLDPHDMIRFTLY